MKQDEVSQLLQRYFKAIKVGSEPYFDADEIDAILESFEQKDDFTHYEAILDLGLRLHPGNNDLRIRESKFYLYHEDYDQALHLVDSIAETNNIDIDMIRLECYCMLEGQYPKAVAYLQQLIDDDCEYLEDIFEFLTPMLSDMEMIDEAKDLIDRGQRLFPDNMELKEELCYVLEAKNQYNEAILVCNELIDKEPYSYDYWFTLGRLYSLTNAFDEAIEAFDFALTCDDSDEQLKILKAYCLFMNENYEKAIEVYGEIDTEDETTDDKIKSLMAECFIKLEDFEQAYHLLKDIVFKSSSDSYVYISYIRCCVETDRGKNASQALIKASDLFPKNVRILSLLALSYIESGREDLALAITSKIINQLSDGNEDNEQEGEYDTFFKKVLQINSHMPSLKPVPTEDLIKEYLSNKKNNN
ncbi:hypothetical protein FACS189414_0600 [Bacteroidia bacterium]|nr:hypothetical protein FACS189414_0600 [Bacteroidia bacterium]